MTTNLSRIRSPRGSSPGAHRFEVWASSPENGAAFLRSTSERHACRDEHVLRAKGVTMNDVSESERQVPPGLPEAA